VDVAAGKKRVRYTYGNEITKNEKYTVVPKNSLQVN
jgi:hypothetical protein